MNNIFLPVGKKLVNLNYLQQKMIYAMQENENVAKCTIILQGGECFMLEINLPELLNLLEMNTNQNDIK